MYQCKQCGAYLDACEDCDCETAREEREFDEIVRMIDGVQRLQRLRERLEREIESDCRPLSKPESRTNGEVRDRRPAEWGKRKATNGQ